MGFGPVRSCQSLVLDSVDEIAPGQWGLESEDLEWCGPGTPRRPDTLGWRRLGPRCKMWERNAQEDANWSNQSEHCALPETF